MSKTWFADALRKGKASGSPKSPSARSPFIGDRLADPNWVAISVNRDRMLPTPPAQLASLSALNVAGASLEPAFSPTTLVYRVQVPKGTRATSVQPVTMSSRATVSVNGAASTRDPVVTVPLKGASTLISLVVTAPDRQTSSTYQVTVTRP